MIIALFANTKKRNSYELAKGVRDFLISKGVRVVARDDEAEELAVPKLSSVPASDLDFLLSFGGDGTILRLIHHFPELTAPILGINLGNLGFMAEIMVNQVYESLTELLNGHYRIEERITVEGISPSGSRSFAVNDYVIHRSRNPTLIDLSIHVDGAYFNTFSADGVIVATPNGSTAYSLASGGPIMSPTLNALVITPICPHTISNRPIVLMPKEAIEIQYLSPYDPIEVSYDGFSRYQLHTNETFKIIPSERKFKMVSLTSLDYFTTLRSKLSWSGQVRYSAINEQFEERV